MVESLYAFTIMTQDTGDLWKQAECQSIMLNHFYVQENDKANQTKEVEMNPWMPSLFCCKPTSQGKGPAYWQVTQTNCRVNHCGLFNR